MKNLIAMTLALLALPLSAQAAPLRSQSGPYELQVLVSGAPTQTFYHHGESYVLGQQGERYTLRVINHSGQRVEAVVSVDGLDVVDGKGADYRNKRGYLVPAYGQVDIEGWRLTQGQVAAFRFSSVGESYAGRTGSAREVGVVGVALFPERVVPPRPVLTPLPRPYNDPYASRDDMANEQRYGGAPAGKAEHRAAPPAPPSASATTAPRAADKVAPPPPHGGGALAEREAPRLNNRPGLGTAFGERLDSPIREVAFVRQNPSSPTTLLGVRYNDYDGLVAMGVNVDGYDDGRDDAHMRRTAEPFPLNERRYANPPPGWEYH